MAIAIFPVTEAAIFPAAISPIARIPLVANTDLLIQAAAILPLPQRQLRYLFFKQLQYFPLLSNIHILILKYPKLYKQQEYIDKRSIYAIIKNMGYKYYNRSAWN